MASSKMVSAIIGVLILMVIGVSLVPTIANESTEADDNPNITGASSALVKLMPLVFVVILVITAIGASKLKGM